ncbi:AAA family ATPase [Haloplasma contractile]|uniref:GTPase subunit of restriction endonuclease protein n=1 Tax=Haloplasma contractile SSD-17B TaxID=1033810 RepID=U2FL16_9MOLU|nr:AAA family ATPase [Haloplasma contractile]ERJ11904.1 GTPase subunit of restriction endonuclease protein [Haloplasma contractile SSD-17B]
MKLFIGKFSKHNPDQIKRKYYSAGAEGSPWYGEVEVGDYVYASYKGNIIGLWKATEYTEMDNPVNPRDKGVLRFEEIKRFKDVNTTNDFTRYKHFIHNLNLVNKSTKSVKSLGFIPIKTTSKCPHPKDIEFKNNGINIYIALDDADIEYKDGDIRVTINNLDEMRIKQIEQFYDGSFNTYKEFNDLYEERNKEDGKYTIRELKQYSIEDNATNKKKFLISVIGGLEKSGYFKVANPIKLYDNLLVGRKRTYTPSQSNEKEDTSNLNKSTLHLNNQSEDESGYEEYADLLNFNANMILYGPPGTGKTYATEKIIDTFEKKHFNSNSNFEQAESEKRVKYITFHQSYSYEEFIEGIRPVIDSNQNDEIGYKIENGVFKEHSINAGKEIIKNQNNAHYVDMINSDSTVWKISLGKRNDNSIYQECIYTNQIAIHFENQDFSEMTYDDILNSLDSSEFGDNPTQNANTIDAFVNKISNGDIVMVYDSRETVRMIGVVKGEYEYEEGRDTYRHRRNVEWFKDLEYPINILKYNNNKALTMKTIYSLSKRISIPNVVDMILEHTKNKTTEDNKQIKPYYMVIDEINRGNISKIFGELITLIEDDKRGKLKIYLPYSKKEFTVPNNLYIIGTMNTADRSIATIDTALRRRFTFVEVEPDSSVLSESDNPIINDTVDLKKLLDLINKKIVNRFDRDHRIGHAYLMGIASLDDLYNTWYFKILPLLSEYFYNDVDSLIYIVGNKFYNKNGNVNFLSTSTQSNGKSEFEEQLVSLYFEDNHE